MYQLSKLLTKAWEGEETRPEISRYLGAGNILSTPRGEGFSSHSTMEGAFEVHPKQGIYIIQNRTSLTAGK